MKKYSVIFTAYSRYDELAMCEAETYVHWLQGENFEEAFKAHIQKMQSMRLHTVEGQIMFFGGHLNKIDVSAKLQKYAKGKIRDMNREL